MPGYNGNYISDMDIDNWPSGTSDADKEAAIKLAEEKLEALTGQAFYAKAFDVQMNGNRKNRLFLGLRNHIITVTQIQIWGEELDPTWYTWDSASVFINICSGAVLTAEMSYLLSQVDEMGLFPRGFNNIRVIGTCGVSLIPTWVKEFCKILVREANSPGLYDHWLLGSESIGNYSYSLGGKDVLVFTGIRKADELLKAFLKPKVIMFTP